MIFIRHYSTQQVYVRIFIRSIVFWYILEMLCFRCSGWSLHTSFYWCNSTRVWKTTKWHVHLSTTPYISSEKNGHIFQFSLHSEFITNHQIIQNAIPLNLLGVKILAPSYIVDCVIHVVPAQHYRFPDSAFPRWKNERRMDWRVW